MGGLGRHGGFTPAEGCMFGAVILFVILLVAMLYLAYVRFRNPPVPPAPTGPAASTWPAPDAAPPAITVGLRVHLA